MIKKIKSNLIMENNFFKVENDDVLFNNTTTGTHLKITQKPLNKGIAVLPLTRDFQVIIQDEYRYGIGKYITQVVKGGVKLNETFQDAVKSELSEELNLKFEKLIELGNFYENPSFYNQHNMAFVALNCEPLKTDIANDGTESFSNKRLIPFSELVELCIDNKLECAVTQMLIMKAHFIINKT
jgi:8-oxo-dGTP pyrophosphatase MutT (NUDIX family)